MFEFAAVMRFIDAVERGNLAAMRIDSTRLPRLLTTVLPPGQTAMHIAARHRQDEVVLYLLGVGTDPDVRDASGQSPLHIAADIGSLSTVKLLTENGANLDASGGSGRETPLYKAALHNTPDHLQVVKFLLEQGASLDLHSAILLGKLDTAIDQVKSHSAAIYNAIDRDRLLHHSVALRHRDVPAEDIVRLLEVLLENGANPNYPLDWNPVLLEAVSTSEAEVVVVSTLLRYGADPTFKDEYESLLEAAESIAPENVVQLVREALRQGEPG